MTILDYKNYIIDYIASVLKDTKKKGIIIGISGGIDSAVTACLLKMACKNKVLCVYMPINNSALDYATTNELVYKFFLNFKQIDLTDTYNSLISTINEKSDIKMSQIAQDNCKSRLRMTTLYAISNEMNYLVAGTTNKCEYELGYYTKFGDGAADFFPLIKLEKSQIYELAKIFEVPDIIIERAPSASLHPKQTDENDFGFKYKDYEKYSNNQSVSNEIKNKIEKIIKYNKHKSNPIKFPNDFPH